jgi:hypothetical protein
MVDINHDGLEDLVYVLANGMVFVCLRTGQRFPNPPFGAPKLLSDYPDGNPSFGETDIDFVLEYPSLQVRSIIIANSWAQPLSIPIVGDCAPLPPTPAPTPQPPRIGNPIPPTPRPVAPTSTPASTPAPTVADLDGLGDLAGVEDKIDADQEASDVTTLILIVVGSVVGLLVVVLALLVRRRRAEVVAATSAVNGEAGRRQN